MRGSPFPVSHAAKAVPRTLAVRPTNSPVGRGVRSPHRRRNRKRLRQSSNCRSRYFCVHLPCPTQVRRTRSALCRSSDLRLRGFPLRPYPAFSGLPNDWLSPTDTASALTAAVTVRDSHPVPLFTFRASMSWCRQRKPQRFLFNSVCIVAPGSQNVKSAVAHPAPIHRPASLFIPGVICYNPLRKPLPFNSGRSGHGLPTSSGGAGGP